MESKEREIVSYEREAASKERDEEPNPRDVAPLRLESGLVKINSCFYFNLLIIAVLKCKTMFSVLLYNTII